MECIVDIKNWMTNNFLLLNSEKTEVLIIGPKNHTSNNLEHCLTLDGCSLDSSSSHFWLICGTYLSILDLDQTNK